MLSGLLGGLLGSFVWVAANFAYYSYVRDSERGGKRFAAFVLGFPITLISMFVAPHTRRLRLPKKNEAQAEHDLLLEIRRDRALREGQGPASGQEDVATGAMPPE